MQRFLTATVFSLTPTQRQNLEQFILAFDTDLAPVVGQQVTRNRRSDATVDARIDLLVARAAAGECDLVVKGNLAGEARGWSAPAGRRRSAPIAPREPPISKRALRNAGEDRRARSGRSPACRRARASASRSTATRTARSTATSSTPGRIRRIRGACRRPEGRGPSPCARPWRIITSAGPSARGTMSDHRLLFEEDRLAYRLRHLGRRPRLVVATLVFVGAGLLLPRQLAGETRWLVAFDLGAVAYLTAIWLMMLRSTVAAMKMRAQVEDERKWTVLVLGSASASAVLLALTFEMHGAKDLPPPFGMLHVALAAATILLSWFFMNTLFALHYAHAYYGTADGGIAGGLAFPGEDQPDYWDFVYFSFVVGMTFQVSDVQVESRLLRRLVVAHGALAFFFNVGVLALAINIAAGLL